MLPATMTQHYDVFISFKQLGNDGRPTRDCQLARGLYEFLTERGMSVFFSDVSLETLGVSAYKKAIDDALDCAQVLIAVGTSRENFESHWVRYEWDSFFNDILSGVKPAGRVFAYLEEVDVANLPRALRQTQVLKNEPGSLQRLYKFISNAMATNTGRSPVPPDSSPQAMESDSSDGKVRLNSLGNELALIGQVKDSELGTQKQTQIYLSTTCASNRDYEAFVRAGGPLPAEPQKNPKQRTWVGKNCPKDLLDHPVIYVPHAAADKFCTWLTEKERSEQRIGPSDRYLLPSYQHWKAVARQTPLDDDAALDRTWEIGASQPTEPVASGRKARFGLLHFFGNVFEWCQDSKKRKVRRRDGIVAVNCNLTVGGGWASQRRWLEEEICYGTYGAIWCPNGWPMWDGGFRVCLLRGQTGEPNPTSR